MKSTLSCLFAGASAIALSAAINLAPNSAEAQVISCGPAVGTPNMVVAGGSDRSESRLAVKINGDRALSDCVANAPGEAVGFFSSTATATFDLVETSDVVNVLVEGLRVDTVLAVVTPQGSVLFNDDGELLNNMDEELVYGSSEVQITDAEPGRYTVLTGVYESVDQPRPGQLVVSSEALSCPDASLPAGQQVTLESGRRLAAAEITGVSGDAALCPGLPPVVGSLPEAATVELILTQPAPFLSVTSETAQFDGTLLVEDPFGSLEFNDDFQGTTSSRVLIADAQPGSYRVYIGAYTDQVGDALLAFETLDSIPCPNAELAPVYATDLAGAAQPHSISIAAGEDVALCPRHSAEATGFFQQQPTMVLSVGAADTGGLVTVRANTDQDGVMLVETPSGLILFNDDSQPGDLSPELVLDMSEVGDYRVWVGGLYREDVTGTLSVSR